MISNTYIWIWWILFLVLFYFSVEILVVFFVDVFSRFFRAQINHNFLRCWIKVIHQIINFLLLLCLLIVERYLIQIYLLHRINPIMLWRQSNLWTHLLVDVVVEDLAVHAGKSIKWVWMQTSNSFVCYVFIDFLKLILQFDYSGTQIGCQIFIWFYLLLACSVTLVWVEASYPLFWSWNFPYGSHAIQVR